MRESLESHIRSVVAKKLKGRVEDFAKWLDAVYSLESDEKRDHKKYIEDVLQEKERLTFDFVKNTCLMSGETIERLFPFNNELSTRTYIGLHRALAGEGCARLSPLDAKAELESMFCTHVLYEKEK